MNKNLRPKTGLAAIAVAAMCGGGWYASSVFASDHDESLEVKADASMDITDLYVFDSAPGKVTIIVCWAGFNDSRMQPDEEGVYNPLALYAIHVDNNADGKDDFTMYWRYGVNAQDQLGIRWEG